MAHCPAIPANMSPLPYTSSRKRPLLLLLLLAIILLALPTYARDADVEASLKRIRHGPVLPAAKPTPVHQNAQQDPYRHKSDLNSNDHAPHLRDHTNNHQPLGQDPQRSGPRNNVINEQPLKRDTQIPPQYTPIVTPAPDQDAVLASQGYKQVTYYTCNTIGGEEHCGWHVPVVKAEGVRSSGVVWMVVGCLAGVFALGLM